MKKSTSSEYEVDLNEEAGTGMNYYQHQKVKYSIYYLALCLSDRNEEMKDVVSSRKSEQATRQQLMIERAGLSDMISRIK